MQVHRNAEEIFCPCALCSVFVPELLLLALAPFLLNHKTKSAHSKGLFVIYLTGLKILFKQIIMKRSEKKMLAYLVVITLYFQVLSAQEIKCDKQVEAGLFDMGKMWTFDYPPADYFRETYNFNADQKWFDEARLSALRFASYCSASFVSADGLVMTNHHCARESGFAVQRKGENITEKGFYAAKPGDERKVPDLYVDQLVKIDDVTDRVLNAISMDSTDAGRVMASESELAAIKKEYADKEGWKGLELETVRFYSGAKFSIYGFKRYTDVRLVFMPETSIAYFGGDNDNFTYPRYDLDCSFFRVYDNGKPLKTDHYFKYNANGPAEGDPVFVIGNPGSTMRLSTISDLEFYRDKQLPFVIDLLGNLSDMYQKYNAEAKSDSISNLIFELNNSLKVYKGELAGLKDPCTLARKSAFEANFRNDAQKKPTLANSIGAWDTIRKANDDRREIYNEVNILNLSGRSLVTGQLMQYAAGAVELALMSKDTTGSGKIKKFIVAGGAPIDSRLEQQTLAIYLQEAFKELGPYDPFIKAAVGDKRPEKAAEDIISATKLKDPGFRKSLITMDSAAIWKIDDPLLNLARIVVTNEKQISKTYDSILARILIWRSRLGRMLFEIYGTRIPPDATFSLRINDGIVKGYDYNGTIAPPHTTYFGLYNRSYSFGNAFPYTLPERWKNPSVRLLKSPLDFVTTNDVIGGNSGSPMVNKNLEVVGLVFDGNIESLLGAYIYIPEQNRTIGVHSAGIIAALRYIYKATRLASELEGK
jgi:hypothetical protein